MLRKLKVVGVLILVAMSMVGCDIVIFEEKIDENTLIDYKVDELENDIYYIKNGTNFNEAYQLESASVNGAGVYWVRNISKEKVPFYYSNELIAFISTKKNVLDNIALERYECLGSSLGIYGAVFEDGYITFNTNTSLVKESSIEKELKDLGATSIRFDTINGTKVSEAMLSSNGCIIGLEENAYYDIEYYAGTYYKTMSIQSDVTMFQDMEEYTLNESNTEVTKNGYLSIKLPEDFKSGYYNLNDSGFFLYNGYIKGEEKEVDYNERYYETKEEQIEAFAQPYSFEIKSAVKDISVQLTYDTSSLKDGEEIVCLMKAPDGTTYDLTKIEDEYKYTCELSQAMGGKWNIFVLPKTLAINGIEVIPNDKKAEAQKEEFPMKLVEDRNNIMFKADFVGEGDITGILTDAQGNTYDLKRKNNSDMFLTYTAPFMAAGEYTITIYHDSETQVLSVYYVNASEDEQVQETDIITVTE